MPELNTFPNTAGAAEVVASIQENSYAIVHDVLDTSAIECVRNELAPHFAERVGSSDDFTGHKTVRFGALLARVPKVREMVLHPLVHGIAQTLLGPSCANIRLNYTGVMHLEFGEKAQTLHRDSGFYPIQNPCPPLLLATMWAISDFTQANGATRIIPGSHLWDDLRKPEPDEIIAAEMPAGSVLFYIGASYHGGGANKAEMARTGIALHYALGWLRQEENQYLAVPQDLARTFSPELKALMGYELSTVNSGFVDHQHPRDVLDGTPAEGPRPLGAPELMAADNAINRLHVDRAEVVGRARHDVLAPFDR
jgi:ectoine hydroxylase-related dioxygenase (phytanoyl-CoA dioxygenase family)